VPSRDFEALRAAYEAANDGDLDALVALFTPDTVWCGTERGILWWRRVPS
jgi:ketosteroid isomerase-like protein